MPGIEYYRAVKSEYPNDIVMVRSNDTSGLYYAFEGDAIAFARIMGGHPSIILPVDENQIRNIISEDHGDYCTVKIDRERKFNDAPQSTVLGVRLNRNSKGWQRYYIVQDDIQQNTRQNVYWNERNFSKALFIAIGQGMDTFEHKGYHYEIDADSIEYDGEYTEKALKYFLEDTDSAKDVYVCRQTSFNAEEFNCVPVTAVIRCADKPEPVTMKMFYSLAGEEYYMTFEAYEGYRKKYGLPFIKLKIPANHEREFIEGNTAGSPLKMYGYDVLKGSGLTREERKKILARLMDAGLMPKHLIIYYLNLFIHFYESEPHTEFIVSRWKDDLAFVNSYDMNPDNFIWRRSIQHG